ncbi:tyrosine-type recombinase/integrase [Dysgonomonas sp. ZJ279]|uniref:tyrosine-type recombinase/integrase n=1 Tax=Dysgonomonas sp. ZJ279 TaxID=2709796 RepID=UPI0013EADB76|nr:phage integrase SAM-like domain-containing protein [Dysgonomonas sp. ZJ279]
MFTITLKGKPNPKDKKLVKLEMVFFLTGYTRVSKALNVIGLFKDWDNTTQSFKSKSRDYIDENKILFDLKTKYLKVAQEWDIESRQWSPVEWSHAFDTPKENKEDTKVLSVSQMIDLLIDRFAKQQRFKNGKVVSSASNVKEYTILKNSLNDFTKQKYGKSLSSYFFRNIGEQFLLDYALYLQMRGAENGNKGAVCNRLKKLLAVCNHAKKIGMQGVNIAAFESVKGKMKVGKFVPKTIPYEVIRHIEKLDRSQLTRIEQFHIDLFLFSFYTGGMANIDVAYLNWNCLKDDMITYERMKIFKEAKVPLIDKAKAIIKKYKDKSYADYVLPVFTHKHATEKQRREKVERLSNKVNETLEKVRKAVKYEDKITWYSARGSFITKMIDDGYHPVLVAEQAGNSPDMIYRHYYKTTNTDEIRQSMNKNF